MNSSSTQLFDDKFADMLLFDSPAAGGSEPDPLKALSASPMIKNGGRGCLENKMKDESVFFQLSPNPASPTPILKVGQKLHQFPIHIKHFWPPFKDKHIFNPLFFLSQNLLSPFSTSPPPPPPLTLIHNECTFITQN